MPRLLYCRCDLPSANSCRSEDSPIQFRGHFHLCASSRRRSRKSSIKQEKLVHSVARKSSNTSVLRLHYSLRIRLRRVKRSSRMQPNRCTSSSADLVVRGRSIQDGAMRSLIGDSASAPACVCPNAFPVTQPGTCKALDRSGAELGDNCPFLFILRLLGADAHRQTSATRPVGPVLWLHRLIEQVDLRSLRSAMQPCAVPLPHHPPC